jgi:prepilin-type N-terminal cleavage/methylation domain-containing protein
MNQPKNLAKKAGFTLIELSIVLVIIGLIVGGVLVGQDLIKAAEIRATIGQIEKYNTAINTFQSKYNGKPGDITAGLTGQAAQFGLSYESAPAQGGLGGNIGHGDGNGLIEGGAAGATNFIGEPLYLWKHLGEANLVDGSYGVVGASAPSSPDVDGTPSAAVTNIAQSEPQAKLGPSGFVQAYSESGLNYYQIIPTTGISSAGAITYGTTGMTPTQAYNIDAKLDDGAPNTGIVRAKSLGTAGNPGSANGALGANGAPSFNAGSIDGNCVIGTGSAATDTYNRIASTGGNTPSCSIRLRFN